MAGKWVICLENGGNDVSLERGKLYRASADRTASKAGLLKITDETGESYLFPASWFEAVALSLRIRRALARNVARQARKAS